MTGNLNDFRSSFSDYLAKPSRFDVMIPAPLSMLQYIGTARNMQYRCSSAQLPGRTFATADQKIYGPTERFPYQSTYNDVALTFIVSDDMQEKMFFDAWMDIINPTQNYNFKYKGDYSTPVRINQYSVTNELVYSVDLVEAYPISMNQMDLDWAADGHHKLTVVFAYTRWINNSVNNILRNVVTAATQQAIDAVSGLRGNIFR